MQVLAEGNDSSGTAGIGDTNVVENLPTEQLERIEAARLIESHPFYYRTNLERLERNKNRAAKQRGDVIKNAAESAEEELTAPSDEMVQTRDKEFSLDYFLHRLSRRKTIKRLSSAGLHNAELFLVQLESIGSPLVFNKADYYEDLKRGKKIKYPDYDCFENPELVKIVVEITDFPLALTRIKALGFSNVWSFQLLASNELVQLLDSVSKIDESFFTTAVNDLKQFLPLQSGSQVMVNTDSYSSNGIAELSLSPNFISVIECLTQGGLNSEQRQVLSTAKQLFQVLGAEFKHHDLHWYFDHADFLRDSLVVCSEIARKYSGFSMGYYEGRHLFSNLLHLDSIGKLQLLASAIDEDGFVIDAESIDLLMGTNLESALQLEDNPESGFRIFRFLSSIDVYVESAQNGSLEQIQLGQSHFLQETSFTTIDQMSEICKVVDALTQTIGSLDMTSIKSCIIELSRWNTEYALVKILGDEYLNTITKACFDTSNQIDIARITEIILETIFKSVKKTDSFSTILFTVQTLQGVGNNTNLIFRSPVVGDLLSLKQLVLLELCKSDEDGLRLAPLLLSNIEKTEELVEGSKLNDNFVELFSAQFGLKRLLIFMRKKEYFSLCSTEIQQKYKGYSQLTDELIAALQGFFEYEYGTEFQLDENIFDEHGQPTIHFFSKLIRTNSLSLIHANDSIRFLQSGLTPEILSQLDHSANMFFSFFVKIDNIKILRKLLQYFYYTGQSAEEYYSGGIPNSDLLKMILLDDPLREAISATDLAVLYEIINHFPNDLKEAWTFVVSNYTSISRDLLTSCYRSDSKLIELSRTYNEQLSPTLEKYPELEWSLFRLLDSSAEHISLLIEIYELFKEEYPEFSLRYIENQISTRCIRT